MREPSECVAIPFLLTHNLCPQVRFGVKHAVGLFWCGRDIGGLTKKEATFSTPGFNPR